MPLTIPEYIRLEGKPDRHPDTIREWCRTGKLKAKKSKGGKDWLIHDSENPSKN